MNLTPLGEQEKRIYVFILISFPLKIEIKKAIYCHNERNVERTVWQFNKIYNHKL